MFLDVTLGFITAQNACLGWSSGFASRWFNELWFECVQIHHRAGPFELGIVYGIAVLVGFLLLKGSIF